MRRRETTKDFLYNLTVAEMEISNLSRSAIRRSRHERHIVALIIVVSVLSGIVFAAVTPFTRGPDEQHYYAEVSELVKSGKFKSFSGHPPLYPSVASLTYRLGKSTDNHIFFTRLLGVLFNALTVFLTYRISTELFSDSFRRLTPALIVALNPAFNFVGASINSDALLTLCATVFFFLTLRVIETSLQPKYAFGLVVVAVLGSLTKQRFLIMYPLYFPLLAFCLYRRVKWYKGYIKDRIRTIGIAVGILVCFFLTIFWVTDLAPSIDPWTWFDAPDKAWAMLSEMDFIIKLFRDFWGNLDWQILPLSGISYAFFVLLMVVGLVGLILRALRFSLGFARGKAGVTWRSMVFFIFFLGVALSVYSVARYATQVNAGAQGRYLFIAVAPIAVFVAQGLSTFVKESNFKWAFAGLAITLLALNYLEFVYNVIPFYY